MIYDIAHININCTDIERSIAFYQKFGFKVVHVLGDDTKGLDPTGDLMAGAEGMKGTRSRGVLLSLGDHPHCWTMIELLQHTQPPTEPEPSAEPPAEPEPPAKAEPPSQSEPPAQPPESTPPAS